jgi:hypothetical protein
LFYAANFLFSTIDYSPVRLVLRVTGCIFLLLYATQWCFFVTLYLDLGSIN